MAAAAAGSAGNEHGRDPAADLSGLLGELQILHAVADPEHAMRRDRARSAWSVAQHLDHILLADSLNLRAIAAIERGRDDGPDPPFTVAAREMLSRGLIPRGVAQSPEPVVPRSDEELAASLGDLAPAVIAQIDLWSALEPRVGSLLGLEGRIAHPALGALHAADWLRFARVHTHHHRLIIEEILGRR